MTAPTSPGVVPADDLRAAIEAYNVVWQDWPDAIDSGNIEWVRHAAMYAALVTDRANRPSLTKDDREQVRREAAEDERDRLLALAEKRQGEIEAIKDRCITSEEDRRWCDAVEAGCFLEDHGAMLPADRDRLRALADRSEPRQEKEDGRD